VIVISRKERKMVIMVTAEAHRFFFGRSRRWACKRERRKRERHMTSWGLRRGRKNSLDVTDEGRMILLKRYKQKETAIRKKEKGTEPDGEKKTPMASCES